MEGDSEKGETTWSFDAAIRLLHIPLIAGRSATRDSDRPIVQPATAISTYRIPESGLVDASTNSLGDFDRLFETLGLAPTSSLPVPPLTSDDDSISSTGDTTRLSRVINEPNTALDKELQISLDRLAGIHEECDSSTARTLGPTLDERNRAIKVKGKKKAIQEQVETKLYTVNEPSFATPAEKKRIRKSKHSEGVESRQNLQNVAQSKSRARLYPETPTKTSTKTPNNSTNHTAFSPHQSRLIQNGEQKQHLLHKLWNQFESDRTTLFDYTSQLRGSTDATGIHIFVDMSNVCLLTHQSQNSLTKYSSLDSHRFSRLS